MRSKENPRQLGPEALAETLHTGNLGFGGRRKGGLPEFFPVGGIFYYRGPYGFYLVFGLLGFNHHFYHSWN
jgi:hypothetical protein